MISNHEYVNNLIVERLEILRKDRERLSHHNKILRSAVLDVLAHLDDLSADDVRKLLINALYEDDIA